MSGRFRDLISRKITNAKGTMSLDEVVVVEILILNWSEGMVISQKEIAAGERWLSRHKRHRIAALENSFETSTRRIRNAIRNLRVRYGIPVISAGDGYWLPQSEQEARDYGEVLLKAAAARAKASMATYTSFMAGLEGIMHPAPLQTQPAIGIAG